MRWRSANGPILLTAWQTQDDHLAGGAGQGLAVGCECHGDDVQGRRPLEAWPGLELCVRHVNQLDFADLSPGHELAVRGEHRDASARSGELLSNNCRGAVAALDWDKAASLKALEDKLKTLRTEFVRSWPRRN